MSSKYDILNLDFREITPHAFIANYKDYYDVNAGAVIFNDYILFIDTLYYPRQAKMFRSYLESKFNLPAKYLFITHYHGDHLFGMSAFKDVEIIGSKDLTVNMLERKQKGWTIESFDKWKKSEPELDEIIDEIEIRFPTIEFEQNYTLQDEKNRVEIIRSGGHSSCSSMAYFSNEKVLFTGDEVASGFWIFMSDKTGNPDHWIESFEQILKLDIEHVVPGHGPIIGKEYIEDQLEFMKNLKQSVLDAISENKEPTEVQVPEYTYEPATEWQIPEALKFMYEFYEASLSCSNIKLIKNQFKT